MADETPDRHGIDAPADEPTVTGLPSMDDFLASALKGLIPGLDDGASVNQQIRGQVIEHQGEMKKEANIFRDTFSTPAGRQCLDLLLDRTLRRRVYGASFETQTLEQLTAVTLVREAENNFVAAILEAIAFANNKDIVVRQEA